MEKQAIIYKGNIMYQSINRLRFWLSVMVVMIHTTFVANYSVPTSDIDYARIIHYAFANVICCAAVPTFFILSGFFFFKNLEEWNTSVYIAKLKKRFKTLFIPFFIAATLMLLLAYCVSVYRSMSTGSGIPSFFELLSKHGWLRYLWDNNRLSENPKENILGFVVHGCNPILSPLWFLRDLMVVIIISPFVYIIAKFGRTIALIIVGMLMVTNIWIPIEGFSSEAFFFFCLVLN